MIDMWLQELEPLRVSILSAAGRLAPRFLAALLLTGLAVALARTTRSLVRSAARTEWLGGWLRRSGILSGLAEPSLVGVRRFVAGFVYWSMLLAGGLLALALLSKPAALRFIGFLMILLPNLLAGLSIVVAAWWFSRYCARSALIWLTNEGVAYPWRWAAFVRISFVTAGVALASEATGFAAPLIRASFLILLAGGTFALACASIPLLRKHLGHEPGPKSAGNSSQWSDDVLR